VAQAFRRLVVKVDVRQDHIFVLDRLVSTQKPWFCDVISTLRVSKSITDDCRRDGRI
jgi:hypothetical protein